MQLEDHVARLEEERKALFAPLREHYAEITKELEALEARRLVLVKTKSQIRALIRVGEPDFDKRDNSRNGRPVGLKYSPERVEQTTTWLQEHAEELNRLSRDGFYGTQIADGYEDFPVSGQSSVSAILNQLRNAGIIRLTKRGGRGGRKYYKVVV